MKLKNIDTLAAEKEYTLAELARRSRVAVKTLYSARNGASVTTRTAGRIAAALGVSVEQILEKR